MVQEHVNDKAVALIIKGAKLNANMLAKAMRKYLAEVEKAKHRPPKSGQGKQTVKELVKQGQGVTNIEIADDNIKSFEKVARKYGVDFALKRDDSSDPPKWLVFFKARDADALQAAFKEFSAETLKKSKEKEKPSVLKNLAEKKEKSAELDTEKVKNKTKELER